MNSSHTKPCHVIVAITGSIAAYKSVELVRNLRTAGMQVRVVMTQGAKAFITPLTLQAVSGHMVREHLFDPAAEAGMDHIELARWADYLCIAPASAHCLAKLATGMADDLLTTLCLATTAKLLIAPAMNQQMWTHPTTQEHVRQLQAQDVLWAAPAKGEQACGEFGQGRLCEPDEIAQTLLTHWRNQSCTSKADQPLLGKSVLITAGPTIEALDPVRYLTNHSSGKMGYALAKAAIKAGANVTLISGPTHLPTPKGALRLDVDSADDMLQAVQSHVKNVDIFIGCAAVANYRPADYAQQKQHYDNDNMTLNLTRTTDILATVAKSHAKPFCVGFAAQTDNVLDKARQKLIRKNADIIIANEVGKAGSGFNSDHNQVTVLSHTDTVTFERMPKSALSVLLIQYIAKAFHTTKKENQPC